VTVQSTSPGLSHREVIRIVNRYIGVEGGYLGDFSYRTHEEFYLEYCDLDINPFDYLEERVRPASGSSACLRRVRDHPAALQPFRDRDQLRRTTRRESSGA
jgi:hypothetical protein